MTLQVFPESRWTAARLDCPYPERWSATDAQSTELEVTELVASWVRALQPEYVVETGTCIGQTAQAIGQALARNGHGWLDTIEVDPVVAAQARERCAGLPVTVYTELSLGFQPAGKIGFAWLDSSMGHRIPEFEHLRPWLAPGAVVGFHDTSPHMGLLGEHVGQLGRAIRLRTPRGVSFVQLAEEA
jgi:predicted O-methyltransferase YrrM